MSFCISKDCNLKKETLQFLYEKYANEESTKTPEIFGGILSNLHYAWLVRKSRIVVVNCKNASRVGSWDFGNTLQDDTVEINKVEEIQRPNGREPHLIISLNCETRGGMICIFDFVGSKVIRAIQIVENITSVHVIDRGQDLFSLSGPLRNFDGVLAVGTVGGNVYILDICRQLCYEGFNSFEARDELNPCQIKIITAGNLLDLENYKKIALCNESHLAIFLNVVPNKKTEHFVLRGPGGSDVLYVNKEEALISSLHYCPQLSSILVGYNFGAFQLWDLMNMELVYTSPICEDHIPIIKFAIQEPADDPRAFCYVWAVYSTDDLESKVLPNLVMYALCYESKEFHENYGVLYENFQYCTVRFQRELGFGNNQSNIKPIGGKCLNLDSLVLKNSGTNTEIYGNDGTEDALSLCVAAWKAVCESGQFTYMAVFDLNQWYKAQMPNSSNFDDCSSYMITLCISDLTNTDGENKIEVFDVNLHKKSIQQFIGTQKLEEHYYPSSLSFETSCLLEHKIVNIQYQGVQTALLCQLQKAGPLCLIRPSETYQEIVALGLTPLFVELNTTSAITSLNNQREVILSVALEQQLTSWLCKCASEWANGSFSSAGCSLDLITSWAHRRAITLKTKCDDLCIPLFDYSDVKLDTNTINILSNCIRQIKNISFIFSYILSKFSLYLTNKDTISELCKHLKMVEVYFDVLQWFFNVGLLPEFTPHDSLVPEDKVRAAYPVNELEEYYLKRRSELLLAVKKRLSMRKSVLFIDNLINVEFGDHLEKDWKKDGGNGFYPPRSIQALLRTYLLDGMEVCNKHSLIIYLLSDLAVILDSQYQPLITNLMKFPAVFKVSPSYIKITHAFWQLDHGGFHHAMEQLLDPMINQEDLKNWHHKVALKSLLLQEQHNLALLYMNVRKPPIVDDEDVLCALSLFISNNMLDEAFYLEKNFSNYSSSKNIIKHLFTECSNYGRLNSIIYRNLTHEEEAQFLKYLDEVKHPEAADLKITYFMQRSHYKEAFNTYQACEDDPTKKGLISRLNLKARDQIVHSYKKFLPTVSYEFIDSCTREPNPTLWKEVSRPDPMSVCVHKADTKTEYKSSMILAALAKARLTFNESVHNVSLLNARTEEIPFLRTPTATPSQKRSSVQVIIPQIVVDEVDEEEDGPSPPKRSRLSFSSPHRTQTEINSSSILTTPIIARKVRGCISPIKRHLEGAISTPASILKVRDSYKTDINNISTPTGTSNTPSRKIEHKTIISGRKPTRTSIVRFNVPSSSPEEPSSATRYSVRDIRTPERNESISFENSPKSISNSVSPKNISDTDDVFYSPNSSLNNIEELPKDTSCDEKKIAEDQAIEPILKISPKKPAVISKAELVKLVEYNSSSSDASSSPKGRRSYRKTASDVTIRSSPRLTKSRDSEVTERESADTDQTLTVEENIPTTSIYSTGKSRKSLNRQVLEANTLSRIAHSADNVETTRTEIFKEEKEISSIVIDNKKSEISCTKIEYADSYMKESSSSKEILEKHSISKSHSYATETTLDSDSSESLYKFDDNKTLGVSDSILEELKEDLRKRPSRADTENKKGIVREQTPLRRRASSRISKITTSSEQSSQSEGRSQSVKASITPIKTSSSSTPSKLKETLLGKNHESSEDGVHISCDDNDYKSGESTDKYSLPNLQMMGTSCASSTPYTDSSKTNLKVNLSKKSKRPLSRQVLEHNALSRLIAEYETSSNEEMKVDKEEDTSTTDTEMLESNCEIAEKQDNISVSDSILEMIAFGKLPREKQLLETRRKSIAAVKKQEPFEPVKDKVPEETELEIIPQTTTSQQSNVTESYDEVTAVGKLPAQKELLDKHRKSIADVEQQELSDRVKVESSKENKLEITPETSTARKNDISLSDSLLELLAFGKSSREKKILAKRGQTSGPVEKQEIDESPDFGKATVSKENEMEITTEMNTKVETGIENMPLDEVCSMIYDDLDDGNNQNNSESNMSETFDDELNHGMLEHSTSESGSLSKSDKLRQEVVTPTVFERNIFDRDYSFDESCTNLNKISKSNTEIIEISSSDESQSSSSTTSSSTSKKSTSNHHSEKDILENDNLTQLNDNISHDKNNPKSLSEVLSQEVDPDCEMEDDLNEAMIGAELSVVASNTTMSSVSFVTDSKINEDSNGRGKIDSNPEIFAQEMKSDENTNSRTKIDTKYENTGQNENESKQSILEEDRSHKPGRRVTRRSSKLLDDQDNALENQTTSLGENEEVKNIEVRKVISTRRASSRRLSQSSQPDLDPSASVQEQPIEVPKSITARKRPRSVDIPLNPRMEENVTAPKTSATLTARRKLRSASVDIPTNIDEELKKESHAVGKSKKKLSSVSDLNDTKEEQKSNKKTLKAIKEELVENYRKGRRLTRRQSNILEQSLNEADLPSMDIQDPIELLDKTEFKGTPDPQEQKVYETSPSSSASAPRSNVGRPARRLSRTSSNASDDSVTSSTSTPGRRRTTVTHVDSPTPRATRRKLRSVSTEENSECKTPEKDKASDIMSDDSVESDTSVISTRSRKSTQSDSNNSSKTRKRKIASKSALPEIREENTEVVSGSPAQNTRRGRKSVQK